MDKRNIVFRTYETEDAFSVKVKCLKNSNLFFFLITVQMKPIFYV